MDAGAVGLDFGSLVAVGVIAVSSLAMVVSMVRFSRAVLARVEARARRSPAEDPGSVASKSVGRWGSAYAIAWLALIAGFLVLVARLEGGWSNRDLGLLALVAGGYLAVHAVLVWFAAALIRANLRGAAPESPPPGSQPYGGGWSGEVAAAVEPSLEPVAPPSLGERLRGFARVVGMLAIVLAFVAVGAAVPALRDLEVWFDLHRPTLVPAVGAIAGVGWALLIGGAIHGVLTAGRDGSFSDAVSFTEVKAAFRSRAWRVSRRWRRFAAMALGAALMTIGLFGLGIVLAPAGIKLLCAAATAWAAVQIVRGFRRA